MSSPPRRPTGEPSGTDRNDLAGQLSEFARDLQSRGSVADTLQAITTSVIGTVPGADYAGLMIIQRRKISTRAVTAEVVRLVDQAQYDTGQGPCLDAAGNHPAVWLPDTGSDNRWPAFSERAALLGIGSMLSLQLYVRHDSLGALNLYARQPAAFTTESEHIGLIFATHAALAMADAEQYTQLSHAIATRDLVGQAKGILMERHKITADQAFAVLAKTSQAVNVKLADVAAQLAETGELPIRPGDAPISKKSSTE